MADLQAYRVYAIDSSGHIYGVEIILAEDDAQAVAAAEGLKRGRSWVAFEVWDGGRRVFPPPGLGPVAAPEG